MSGSHRRGTNLQPLEIQALLKACLKHKVEEFRRAGKAIGPLFYDIQREMARGDFPERPLTNLRQFYNKVQRSYKRGQKPYPPEARQLWGRLEDESDVSANDAAWLALTQKKMQRISTCTYLTKLELAEVCGEALRKNVESLSESKQKQAFESILKTLHWKKLFLGRNADYLRRTYNRLKKRYLKGKYDREFPESAAKLWSGMREGVSERGADFSYADSPGPHYVENAKMEGIDAEMVCSICQGCAYEAKHLFRDIYQNQTYAEIINQTLKLEMLWNGRSSALICQLCSTYVESLPVFWNQCRKSCDILNGELVAKENTVLEESTFCESTSKAVSPSRDVDEVASIGSVDFQANDTLDEMTFEEVSETTIGALEEVLPEEEGSNPQVEATDKSGDEQNVVKLKKNRCSYWKRVPKQCELCGKTVLDIKSHINSHYQNKPEACDFCPKRFTSRNQLLMHRNTHTRERQYPCSYCDAVYDSWGGKNYHEKAHIVEINNISYDCNECDARFSMERNLKNHIKFKHRNLRKLRCTECGFSTITKTRLLNHVRSIHSKERPYQCPYCNFNANSNTGYFIHFKRHKNSGEAKEYHMKCGYCEEMFLKDSIFEKHILQEHPDRAIKV
uniref:Putative zinc finger and scan domain-containing protein 12 n=1 Tax=Culex tarsalis TaxID=7177 RepID=A0A1Q3EZF6_CULTA